MLKKKDFTISDGGLSRVENVVLGGIEQSILVQAEDLNNPVLLFLHGGPSLPLPGVSSMGQDYTIVMNTKELVKHYIVVFWDQRGTGKSYNSSMTSDMLTVNHFLSDAKELVEYLCKRFEKPKVLLSGHSWGSILGLQLAYDIPHLLYCYVGFSQIVNWAENDVLSWEWAKQMAINKKDKRAIEELNEIGKPPYYNDMKKFGTLRQWQVRYKSLIYSDKTIKHPGFSSIFKSLFMSQTYSIKDIFNTLVKGGQLVYNNNFVNSIYAIDFVNQSTKSELKIPVTFVHGEKETHIFGSIVQAFFEQLKTENKELVWRAYSGHAFHPTDTKENELLLINKRQYMN